MIAERPSPWLVFLTTLPFECRTQRLLPVSLPQGCETPCPALSLLQSMKTLILSPYDYCYLAVQGQATEPTEQGFYFILEIFKVLHLHRQFCPFLFAQIRKMVMNITLSSLSWLQTVTSPKAWPASKGCGMFMAQGTQYIYLRFRGQVGLTQLGLHLPTQHQPMKGRGVGSLLI